MHIMPWLLAIRPRTLPLALGSIAMGYALTQTASPPMDVNTLTLALIVTTTLLLQILSNLANDYGDGLSGVDNPERQGPQRMLASGTITQKHFKQGLKITAILTGICGLTLILNAVNSWADALIFLVAGALSVIAAVTYSVGNRPYGYIALGDVSVFVFFGLLAVLGSAYLLGHPPALKDLLVAISAGCFATGVLNINNMRDAASDSEAGKVTIANLLGQHYAVRYQFVLVGTGCISLEIFYWLASSKLWGIHQLLIIYFTLHSIRVAHCQSASTYNQLLKMMVIGTFAIEMLFLLDLIWLR
ncbi:MAG: 1,4-dihydroxy-2-naphthoate octaprenyltransferase [Pseudomonadales bacterium]|nr:1,4-dihydroxy-2-naphthoate octaprenyltransferase [Pseudomonadales bacterium]